MRSWAERGFSYKDEETKLEGQGVEKQDKGFVGIVYQNVSLRDQPARRRGCVLPSPRVVHMCVRDLTTGEMLTEVWLTSSLVFQWGSGMNSSTRYL